MIGQSAFPYNFSMLGNPIATEPLNPNSANYGTSTGMQSLLQALEASTYEFEAAAYNPSINSTPQNGAGYLATSALYQPQFPNYTSLGLNTDPYYNSMGSSFGQMGQTNPYFNASFTGAMTPFYGEPSSQQSWNPQSWNPGQSSSNGCPAASSSSGSSSSGSTSGHHHHHHHHSQSTTTAQPQQM